ncbi:MAG: phospho-N-acetylmuramoyl-pentapeptide-transferase [Campylobacteraceae bacterium 4484_166]|nr:MAG: phospho-N-acetylmuramoyl-pentapeptide-transferase [Campylobacteraceae bacterium 4484_166]
MLYFLYDFFGINIFQYITVRAGFGFLFAFIVTQFVLPKFIIWAKNTENHQPIFEYAPKTHGAKDGTPTMGGAVFTTITIVSVLLSARLDNLYVWGGIVIISAFAYIGITDDMAKIKLKTNEAGLSVRSKLIYQFIASAVVALLLFFIHDHNLFVPFYKNPLFDMDYFAIIFWILVIVASSNAVNLTDGLDGLATVPSIVALATLSLIIYVTGHAVISNYLLMPNIKGSGELFVIGLSLMGSLIAFLWFNSHPAQIFMGDSGSLPVGAFMGYIAIVGKSEILLLLIGFIFVFETVSVILQIGSFKIRKKRVFRMAPIHHHFEQKGWHENKIIVRFWIISFMSNIIALISLKIR